MKIVVGYIRTAEGRAALDAAIAEARLRDGSLLVVHSAKGGSRDEAAQMVAYRDDLEAVRARLANEGVVAEIHELVRGNTPADDLIAVAESAGAGLIVIGLRRRSPVGKVVLGSNAQDLLLRASCPVLAVTAS